MTRRLHARLGQHKSTGKYASAHVKLLVNNHIFATSCNWSHRSFAASPLICNATAITTLQQPQGLQPKVGLQLVADSC